MTVHQKQESIFTSDKERKEKRERKKQKKNTTENDIPKSFARLLAFQKTGKGLPSGLDDGTKTRKKTKKKGANEGANDESNGSNEDGSELTENKNKKQQQQQQQKLQILPGESLGDFAARVDQSLPLTSIPKHQTRETGTAGIIKTHLTKHNKRLARLQSEWRATEQKLKAREQDEEDELADKREEDALLWLSAGVQVSADARRILPPTSSKKKKRKDDDADPWKQLEKKRRLEGELARQRNLQDVVLAPPTLKPLKNIFKEK